jgi:hypothetical protein
MHPIAATGEHSGAIRAIASLLERQRIPSVFVGNVARAAYLGTGVGAGSVDVIATLSAEQKNAVAMMASHRGFEVQRELVEATEELDLIPLHFGGVRVHVLVASNALYGRMVADGVEAAFEDLTLRVPRIEDFALLLQMNDELDALAALAGEPEFDRTSYNRKLESIGLRALVIPE